MNKRIDPALLLALLIPIFAIAPLVQNAGIPNLADGIIHVLRQVDFDRALRDGALVPRWGVDLYAGFGYPLYVFAPPLLAYGIELFHLSGLAMDDALKLCVALTLELYSAGMFLFMRPRVGARGALVAAALNTYAPLRLREALVTGGNYPQFLAMALFAPTLWAFDGIVRTRARRYLAGGAAGYAALMLSHIFHAMIFTPVLMGYVLLQLLTTRAPRRAWLMALGAGALALALSAFFWLPAAGERSLTRTAAEQYVATSNYHERFLSWGRLLAPPAPLDLHEANADVPLALGWAPLGAAAAGLVLETWRAARLRQRRDLLAAGFFVGVLGVSVFLQLPDSARVWENVALLPVAEFPWRFMGLSALALAVLGGHIGSVARGGIRPLSSLLIGTAILAAVVAAFPYMLAPRGWIVLGTPDPSTVLAYEQSTSAYGLTTINEYLPQSVLRLPADMPAPLSAPKIDLPPATFASAQWSPHGEREALRAAQDMRVRFRQFNYPGWQVLVDGQSTAIATGDDGTIGVNVPAGQHLLEARFTTTTLRTTSELLSLAALLGALAAASPLLRGSAATATERSLSGTDKTPSASTASAAHSLTRAEALALAGLLLALLVLKLAVLDPQGRLSAARALTPLAAFGDQIELLGAQSDEQVIARGATLHVRFFWRATQPLDKDYHVFAQLFDAAGQAVAGSDKQHPGDPVVQGESPTSQWTTDKYLRDEHRIDVPATVPAGVYQLQVGLYDPQTGKRLRLLDGETTAKVLAVEVK